MSKRGLPPLLLARELAARHIPYRELVFANERHSFFRHESWLRAFRAAEAVTGTEQAWLDAHLDADHKRDPYEEALLAFIAEESGR